MNILCVFGQHNYGDPKRGESYEYANFIPSLRHLGHQVIFLESWDRSCYKDFRELNRLLLRTVEQKRPDVILAVMFTYEIWLETWKILRDAGIGVTINWTTDDSWKYDQFSRLVAPALHAFTTTYPDIYTRYHRDGIQNVLLTQWAANAAQMNTPLPAAECQYPVSFIGTAHGKRRAWVEALRRKGIEVACFGQGWPHGPIASSIIPEIIRKSIISLNFANSGEAWRWAKSGQSNQIKARTFEVPGAGGFLLTEWADGLNRYYEVGREIDVFHGISELADKIRHYLAFPKERDAITYAGYIRTQRDHTYDLRLKEVVEFALDQRRKYYATRNMSPSGNIKWSEFEEAVKHHKTNWKLQLLKSLLIFVCSILWGSSRGPRAARRIIFELSWRLAGAQSYSASGLPGRMFYGVS